MAAISPWVARFSRLIPEGEVLDLACGSGRHAHHLAALGHPVLAVDRDAQALGEAAGPGITTMAVDLEEEGAVWPFAGKRFAGIVVTNYLHRPLFAQLIASLASDGVLIYETFAAGNEAYGKPSNPAFLLAAGELLVHTSGHGLRVLAYEDVFTAEPKPAMVQRVVAAGPAFPMAKAVLSAESSQE